MRACWCAQSDLQPFSAEYVVCASCGTLVSRFHHERDVARVSSDDSDLYGKDYWFGHMENDLGFSNIYQRARTDLPERNLHWLRALLKYRVPPARVLELGSAHGGFVAILKSAGFDASGLELSPAIAEIARTLFDVPMLVGPAEDQAIPSGSLGVIALMDVLEHLPDPVATMRHCIELLTPDGFLLIQTPKFPEGRSFDDLTRDDSPFLEQFKANEHLYLFSERSVRQFFAEFGLESLVFEPALFSHYDMFFAASRRPLAPIAHEIQEERLLATPGGRVVLALLDLQARLEGSVPRAILEEVEADRAARLELIERQGADLGQLIHDNAILRGELDGLKAAYEFSESDREARLRLIEELGARVGTAEHSLAEARAGLEATRQALEASESDRAARLSVIEDQGRLVGDLDRTIAELREQGQALMATVADLRDTKAELEQRTNQGISQLIRARLRGKSGNPAAARPEAGRTQPVGNAASAAQLAEQLARGPAFDRQLFRLWEQHGFHITPNHFYSPIPDVARLDESLWERSSDLTGIDMNPGGQLELLRNIAAHCKGEYDAFPDRQTTDPTAYYFDQPMFRSVDAEMLYGIIRRFRPRRIVEIGSGFSTLVAAAACRKNLESGHVTELVCIEPFPNETLTRGVPGVTRLIPRPLEQIESSLFSSLTAQDILFIDSSHVLRIGNDVYREYLSILPSLQPGVLVHVHDIFLPHEYPRTWVMDEFRFWSEQYLLQAFLTFNSAFKVMWAACYMHHEHREALRAAFRSYDPATVLPGSFWIQRV